MILALLMKTASMKGRNAIFLQMPLVFVKMDSARYHLDVEPKVLSSKQLAILASRKIVKMRGLASGLTEDAYLVLVETLAQ